MEEYSPLTVGFEIPCSLGKSFDVPNISELDKQGRIDSGLEILCQSGTLSPKYWGFSVLISPKRLGQATGCTESTGFPSSLQPFLRMPIPSKLTAQVAAGKVVSLLPKVVQKRQVWESHQANRLARIPLVAV